MRDIQKNVIPRVTELAQLVVTEFGLDLYDVKLSGGRGVAILQVFIDSPKGIGLEECENVSRRLSLVLDAENVPDFSYSLEVSSPGIFRELKTDHHIQGALGKRVQVKLIKGANASVTAHSHIGILTGFDRTTIQLADGATQEPVIIERQGIKKLTLAPKL